LREPADGALRRSSFLPLSHNSGHFRHSLCTNKNKLLACREFQVRKGRETDKGPASEGLRPPRRRPADVSRKPKLSATQAARARELVGQGIGLRAVAAEMNVHHSTIARLL